MKKILILSGPTHEYIDPVRYIGNASSGLMGKAIAEEAVKRGYTVDFISGPVCESNLPDLGNNGCLHRVTGARQMLEAAEANFDAAHAIIFAAAVADYAPANKSEHKINSGNDEIILRLLPNPDIAKTLCARKRPGQMAIGFALQTDNHEAHARRKLVEKNLDGIVLNSPESLGASAGTFSYLAMNTDTFEAWGTIDKVQCAENIINKIG